MRPKRKAVLPEWVIGSYVVEFQYSKWVHVYFSYN